MTARKAPARRKSIRPDQVTAAMLAPVVRAANRSKLPQTVWASRWFGGEYVGDDCLLTSTPAHGLDIARDRPSDAADGCEPFMTVLPDGWYS